MRVRRISKFPGRTITVNEIDPEVGQVVEVPDELGAMLIARGDFAPAGMPWEPRLPKQKPKPVPPREDIVDIGEDNTSQDEIDIEVEAPKSEEG